MGNKPSVVLKATNPYRYSGIYTIYISPYIKTNETVPFRLSVTAIKAKNTSNSSSEAYSLTMYFFLSLSVWTSLAIFIRRIRERIYWNRLNNEIELYYQERIPPKLYIVTLDIHDLKFTKRSSSKQTSLSNLGNRIGSLINVITDNVSNVTIPREKTSTINKLEKVFSRLFASTNTDYIQLKDIEKPKIEKECSIVSTTIDRSFVCPISIEHIPAHPFVPNMPELTAVSVSVLFPDAQSYMSEGLIPPVSIGVLLYELK